MKLINIGFGNMVSAGPVSYTHLVLEIVRRTLY